MTSDLCRAAAFLPTAVAVLTHEDIALTVSSLHCISHEPPYIGVAFERSSRRGRLLLEARHFQARILRAGEQDYARNPTGAAPSTPALVQLDCRIVAVQAIGDHDHVIAEVTAARTAPGVPLLYWRRAIHEWAPHYPFLASEQTFDSFVRQWESGTLPRTQWTHAAHVAIGACYAIRHGAEALTYTRAGILRYNAATGLANTPESGYHETLTRLWADVIARTVAHIPTPYAAACHAVAHYGEDRDLHKLFYSFDVVRSPQARAAWIPPDRPGLA